jgi:hypothetical protein
MKLQTYLNNILKKGFKSLAAVLYSTLKICHLLTLPSSVADPDPGSGAFLTPGSRTRDPGWVKSKDPDPGSGMNNPDRIS